MQEAARLAPKPHFVDRVLSRLFRFAARLGIRHGYSEAQLSEMLRYETVQDIKYEPAYRIFGKKMHKSRVATLSGITRREVQRLWDSDGPDEDAPKPVAAIRVLGGWVTDPRFLDETGQPKTLKMRRTDGVDFHNLAHQYGNDIPARSILDELVWVGCVAQVGKDEFQVVKSSYMPIALPESILSLVDQYLRDAFVNMDHNLTCDAKDHWLYRNWYFNNIPVEMLSDLRKQITEASIAHGRKMEKILSEVNHQQRLPEVKYARAGISTLWFQHE
ncbi:MAG: DUF6502 family protein [Gammaproteobacteria bacterium]|nr:DUF6502 family protein [Gammaproteobacteria bacterium]